MRPCTTQCANRSRLALRNQRALRPNMDAMLISRSQFTAEMNLWKGKRPPFPPPVPAAAAVAVDADETINFPVTLFRH